MDMFGFCGGARVASASVFAFAFALTACNEATAYDAPQTAAAPGEESVTGPQQAQAAPAKASGPLDGEWRCRINGDIPIGLIRFSGTNYSFRTTNTAWRLNPNASDGDGVVEFTGDGYILPQTGPLKDEFEVTGAHSDTVINWNTNLGSLMSCGRSPT